MKMFIAVFVLLTAIGFAQDGPQFLPKADPRPEGMKWVPVVELSDEFDGTKLDLKKWQANPKENGWVWIGRPPGLFHERSFMRKFLSLDPKWPLQFPHRDIHLPILYHDVPLVK